LRMSVWFLVVSSFSLSSCCCFSPCLDNAVLAQTLLVRHAHVHSHPHCQASLAYTRMCMCFHTPIAMLTSPTRACACAFTPPLLARSRYSTHESIQSTVPVQGVQRKT
jgi:hypothetical protein